MWFEILLPRKRWGSKGKRMRCKKPKGFCEPFSFPGAGYIRSGMSSL